MWNYAKAQSTGMCFYIMTCIPLYTWQWSIYNVYGFYNPPILTDITIFDFFNFIKVPFLPFAQIKVLLCYW